MTFTEAVKTCYTKKYADFNGRASRSEFWWFVAFNAGVPFTLAMLGASAALIVPSTDSYATPAYSILLYGLIWAFNLASIVPFIAVAVRRLHDTGKPGTYFLLVLVPWVGGIIVLVLCALEPNRGPNMYGPDPLDPNGQSLGLTNPYAYPVLPYGYGYPTQPYGYGYPTQPGTPQAPGLPYGADAFPGRPAASSYSQPPAPQPAQGNGQKPYGFDFSKPEGYGSGN